MRCIFTKSQTRGKSARPNVLWHLIVRPANPVTCNKYPWMADKNFDAKCIIRIFLRTSQSYNVMQTRLRAKNFYSVVSQVRPTSRASV